MKPVYNKWVPFDHELWDTLSAQFEPEITKRNPDGSVEWEQDIEPRHGEFSGRKFSVRGSASNRDLDDPFPAEMMEHEPEGRTSRIGSELRRIAQDLKPCVDLSIENDDPKKGDFVIKIISEIEDLADRIRRNEGLEMELNVFSKDDVTRVTIRMSDHDALKAIREEIQEVASKIGKKRKLEIKYE